MLARQNRRQAMLGLYLVAAMGMAIAALAFNPWIMLLAAGVFTVAESLMMPLFELITADHAKEGSGATYYGGLNVVWAIGAALGSSAGPALADRWSAGMAWLCLMGVGLLAAVFCS